MLKHLYIKNFTLIDELDMEFRSGFSVITGETGAGKSIILGAIGLLLGQRADSKTIKIGTDKCVVEAHFDLSRYQMEDFFLQNDIEYDATDCIIRREMTAAGKSRAFINDTPVPLTMLKELGERLIDIHSQHQNLLLGKQDFQLNVVDIIADSDNQQSAYCQAYNRYEQLMEEEKRLREEIERTRQNADFMQFQFDELEAAHLVSGEQEELEQRSDTMSHAEDIKSALYEADTVFSSDDTGIVSSLKKAVSAMQGIERVCLGASELAQRMDSCYIELKDIASEVNGMMEDVDFDPSELDTINARLDKIYDLQKKYHVETVEELIATHDELHRQLNALDNSDEALQEVARQCERQHEECKALANELTKKRRLASKAIEQQMSERLIPLGMPNVRFNVAIEEIPLGRNGQDKIAFLFSANTSTPLQPVSQVASGGEIARVMLALKVMISGAVKLPTIIFDEIDTGVSGKMAEQMARLMGEMGKSDRQVISITHLPQIAALGTTHYKVYKEETAQGTTSSMQLLNDEERVCEIAQMLSGSEISDAAIQNAKELLKR